MDSLYHHLSKKKWQTVERTGILQARSEAWGMLTPYNQVNERVKRLINLIITELDTDKFIVGLQQPLDPTWQEAGLLPPLMEHIGVLETTLDDLVIIEVPIGEQRGFVREHLYESPQYLLEQYGIDLIAKQKKASETLTADESLILQQARLAYYNSTVDLRNYHGQFKAPEIWLATNPELRALRVVFINGHKSDITFELRDAHIRPQDMRYISPSEHAFKTKAGGYI